MSHIEKLPTKFSLVLSNANPEPKEDLIHVGNSVIKKPDGWPTVMVWPPKRLRDAVRNNQLKEDKVPDIQRYYDKYALLTRKSADRFEEHLKDHSVNSEDKKNVLMFKMKKRFPYDGTRNHNHIAWAFILDPNGDFRASYDQSISSMGRTTLTTLDGGRISASEKSIRILSHSEMTADVLVEEALARGWTHISIAGGPVMVEQVMRKAKARGLEVRGVIRKAPWGIKLPADREVFSMETVGVDKESIQELSKLNHKMNEETPDKAVRRDEIDVADSGPEGPNAAMV